MQYYCILYSFFEISIFGLGIMIFGEQNSEVDVYQQFDYVVVNGINLIDVVEMYLVLLCLEIQGLIEIYVGNWLVKCGNCEKLVFVLKVSGFVCNNDSSIWFNYVLDCKNICEVLYVSLKWLQIDYFDLYQVYWLQWLINCFGKLGYIWVDVVFVVMLLDIFEVLIEFQCVGKICYIGVLNEIVFGVMCYLYLVDKYDFLWIVIIQNFYSLLNCSFEVGFVEVSQFEGVELLVYFCLVFGILIGKYFNGVKLVGVCNMLFSCFMCYSSEQLQKVVVVYVDIVKCYGFDLV